MQGGGSPACGARRACGHGRAAAAADWADWANIALYCFISCFILPCSRSVLRGLTRRAKGTACTAVSLLKRVRTLSNGAAARAPARTPRARGAERDLYLWRLHHCL